MYQTISQIVSNSKLEGKIVTGAYGKKLEYVELDDVSDIKVSTEYQRLLSPSQIKKYGEMNRTLMVPGVIAVRPYHLGEQGGKWCLDGQHKATLFALSKAQEDGDVYPAMILQHDDDATLEDCLKIEAELFHALNTARRKLDKIDIIRAGVLFDDPEACWILTVMESLKLHCDRFGSLEDDAYELKSFNQFYIMTTKDYPINKGIQRHINGWKLWNDVFRESFVTGPVLRGCTLTAHFMDEVLNDGQRATFHKFLKDEYKNKKQATFMKGLPQDGNTHKWVLHQFLFDFKDYCSMNDIGSRHCIGYATMAQAQQISSRFDLSNLS